jgi:hypothetical protein
LKHRQLDISLRLDAEDIDKEYMESKGVFTPKKGRTMIYSNESDHSARNWMDVKLLNLPFKVLVSVAVDFRKCMGAPGHHEGICRVPGCQVGLFGVQVKPALNLDDISMYKFADNASTAHIHNPHARESNHGRVHRISRSCRARCSQHCSHHRQTLS